LFQVREQSFPQFGTDVMLTISKLHGGASLYVLVQTIWPADCCL